MPALPPISVLTEPVTCFPAWHRTFGGLAGLKAKVTSGCGTLNGSVQCDPAEMARAASRKVGFDVSLGTYTLARYFASEVGSGTLEEKVAVGQNAINRMLYVERKATTAEEGILKLLLYRQPTGHANRGFYGPIHRVDPVTGARTSPYGRWAATSRDPTIGDLQLARAILNGTIDPGFNKGADDQMGPDGLKDPVGSVRSHGAKRDYWVGPLPGVNPWHTFQYRHLPDVAPNSELGSMLIARGVKAMQSAKPVWIFLPVCDAAGHVSRLARSVPVVGAAIGAGLVGLLVTGLVRRTSAS